MILWVERSIEGQNFHHIGVQQCAGKPEESQMLSHEKLNE